MNRLHGMLTSADEIASANLVDHANCESDNSDGAPSTADFSRPAESRSQFSAAVLTTVDRRRCRSLQAPLHYEAGYAYPLLIWLHGDGGDERQLQFVMKHISLRNYVSAAPRGPASAADVFDDDEYGQGGYVWRQEDDHIFLAQERIWDCVVEAKKQFNVHPDRVFLAGYQSGGTMAVRRRRFPSPSGSPAQSRCADRSRPAARRWGGLSTRSGQSRS